VIILFDRASAGGAPIIAIGLELDLLRAYYGIEARR
jgi:hypothetical protein